MVVSELQLQIEKLRQESAQACLALKPTVAELCQSLLLEQPWGSCGGVEMGAESEESLSSLVEHLGQCVGAAQQRVRQLEESRVGLEQQCQELSLSREAALSRAMEGEARASELSAAAQGLQGRVEEAEGAARELQEGLREALGRQTALEEASASTAAELAQAQEELRGLRESERGLRAELEATLARGEAARASAVEDSEALAQLRAEVASLQGAVETLQGREAGLLEVCCSPCVYFCFYFESIGAF